MESEPGRQDLLLETHVTEPLCRHTPLGVSNTLQDITTINSYSYYEGFFLSKVRLLLQFKTEPRTLASPSGMAYEQLKITMFKIIESPADRELRSVICILMQGKFWLLTSIARSVMCMGLLQWEIVRCGIGWGSSRTAVTTLMKNSYQAEHL